MDAEDDGLVVLEPQARLHQPADTQHGLGGGAVRQPDRQLVALGPQVDRGAGHLRAGQDSPTKLILRSVGPTWCACSPACSPMSSMQTSSQWRSIVSRCGSQLGAELRARAVTFYARYTRKT